MTSQTNINLQNVFDSIFGCCIGIRRSANRSISSDQGGRNDDERTPLLGGGQGSRTNQQDLNNSDPSRGLKSNNQTDSKGAQSNDSNGNKRRKALGIISQRNREINLAKLKSIRENANCAFFNVESSQLLPSSSSTLLSQRMTNMGSSHRKFAQQKVGAGMNDESNAGNGLINYTSQQRKELIVASDKAERLYKAALKSSNKDSNTTIDEEGNLNALTVAGEKKNGEVHGAEEGIEERAPIGLVRQIRLSVRDVGNSYNRKGEAVKNEDGKKELQLKQSPHRPVFTLRDSSESIPTDEGSSVQPGKGGTSGTRTNIPGRSNTIASVHSLRTLRLGPALTSQLSLTDAGMSTDSDVGIYGKSQQSNTTTTHDGSLTDKQTPTDDEETWERRGRTRSRRGLVWMDTSTINKDNNIRSKSRLEEIWKGGEEEGGHAKTDLTESDLTQTTVQQSQLPPLDEVQYGLRFEVKKSKEKKEEMTERLKNAITQPMADTWEENNNNNTT